MAAPVSFRERSDSFPLHRGRRPYMALKSPAVEPPEALLTGVLRKRVGVMPDRRPSPKVTGLSLDTGNPALMDRQSAREAPTDRTKG
jgi:hypothetical protein